MKKNDKTVELARYDNRAQNILANGDYGNASLLGSEVLPEYFKSSYLFYEAQVGRFASQSCSVLELGAGSGMHTLALLKTGAFITAIDISPSSLEVIKKKYSPHFQNLRTEVADIEALPFCNDTFDVVCCAGSLSYGALDKVLSEITRVLKPGGVFLCVDSLNNNPIYRFNRWIHYLKGARTKSTIINMPDISVIKKISDSFECAYVNYYGSISYLMPTISRLFGEKSAAQLSNAVDNFVGVKKSAFRFVLVAKGLNKVRSS
jgi:ubiquinone/menaquinone biosynthesis C-methylase UbiE